MGTGLLIEEKLQQRSALLLLGFTVESSASSSEEGVRGYVALHDNGVVCEALIVPRPF